MAGMLHRRRGVPHPYLLLLAVLLAIVLVLVVGDTPALTWATA